MKLQHPQYAIESLSEEHDRKSFCCEVEALDHYFWQQAGQEVRKHIAAVFVLTEITNKKIAGYYTLSSLGVYADELPKEITKKLPKYPLLPATLLGRLAVDKNYKGKKLGELLLADALQRSLTLSKEIASMAIVVDAKNELAINFYKRYGFFQFSKLSHRLFLPMITIENFHL